MKVEVQGSNVMGAYRKLMKRLEKENVLVEAMKSRFYISKSQKRRMKRKLAIQRQRIEDKKRFSIHEKEENKMIVDSKKRAKEYKKNKQ